MSVVISTHKTLPSSLPSLQQNVLLPYEFPYETQNKTEMSTNHVRNVALYNLCDLSNAWASFGMLDV